MTSDSGRTIQIVIADDHPILRDGLRRLLEAEADLRVLGAASDGIEAIRMVQTRRPDILLLDLAMPRQTGLDVLRALAETREPPRVILLTAAIDERQILDVFRLGARGVVLKESATSVLLTCIRAVMDGGYWMGDAAMAPVTASPTRQPSGPPARREPPALTPRQLEIVVAAASGATNRDIAGRLGIAEDTVKQHLTAIYDKCGVSNRVELALFAVHRKLIEE